LLHNRTFVTCLCLYLQLRAPVEVATLSAGTSRLVTSNKLFHSPRYLPPYASDSAFADIVRVYKFHLLTYLLAAFAVRHSGIKESPVTCVTTQTTASSIVFGYSWPVLC